MKKNKGRLCVEVRLGKEIYDPGEVANIKVDMDASESLLDVNQIKIECHRRLMIYCRDKTDNDNKLTRNWSRVLSEVTAEGVKAGSDPKSFELNPEIKIPEQFGCSTEGTLVHCEHFFKVIFEMKTPFFSCKQHPVIEYPFKVGHTRRVEDRATMKKKVREIHSHPKKDFKEEEGVVGIELSGTERKGGSLYAPVPSVVTENNPFHDDQMDIDSFATGVDFSYRRKVEGSGMVKTNSTLSSALKSSQRAQLEF